MLAVIHIYECCVETFSALNLTLSPPLPLSSAWPPGPPGSSSHKSLHKGPYDLPERITKTWQAILTCFQTRYSQPFTTDLLGALSPLLVFSLSCKRDEMAGETLRFWSATFDMAREPLVYPKKLREVFVKLRSKGDLVLKLPGFEVNCYTHNE